MGARVVWYCAHHNNNNDSKSCGPNRVSRDTVAVPVSKLKCHKLKRRVAGTNLKARLLRDCDGAKNQMGCSSSQNEHCISCHFLWCLASTVDKMHRCMRDFKKEHLYMGIFAYLLISFLELIFEFFEASSL